MFNYSIILCDPPWRYDFSVSKSRKIENQYPTMTIKELSELKIPSAENCIIYMWATSPKLQEALYLIKEWKFEYKSHMIWDKEKMGMGYWFRGQHELLLVGTKGKCSPPSPDKRISSVLREKRGNHSSKPLIIRKLISSWYPNVKKLEMFSRIEGDSEWDVFGNEVKEGIIIN